MIIHYSYYLFMAKVWARLPTFKEQAEGAVAQKAPENQTVTSLRVGTVRGHELRRACTQFSAQRCSPRDLIQGLGGRATLNCVGVRRSPESPSNFRSTRVLTPIPADPITQQPDGALQKDGGQPEDTHQNFAAWRERTS